MDELGPILAAFDIALVRARGAERDAKTDDEAEDCEQQIGYDQWVPELTDTGYDGRPDCNENERNDHARCDATSHAEEVGHSAESFNIERLGHQVFNGARMAAG